MTIREYVSQKLRAFGLTEADMADITSTLGISMDDEYTFDIASSVGKAMIPALEELILAPRLSNVNEGGFSMSWNFDGIGKYYLYLCNKWGVPVNDDVLSASGISVITDKSEMW